MKKKSGKKGEERGAGRGGEEKKERKKEKERKTVIRSVLPFSMASLSTWRGIENNNNNNKNSLSSMKEGAHDSTKCWTGRQKYYKHLNT